MTSLQHGRCDYEDKLIFSLTKQLSSTIFVHIWGQKKNNKKLRRTKMKSYEISNTAANLISFLSLWLISLIYVTVEFKRTLAAILSALKYDGRIQLMLPPTAGHEGGVRRGFCISRTTTTHPPPPTLPPRTEMRWWLSERDSNFSSIDGQQHFTCLPLVWWPVV